MKITRRQLRKILLREIKLIQEGGVKNLIIEIGESIEEIMDNQGVRTIPFVDAVNQTYPMFAEQMGYDAPQPGFFSRFLGKGGDSRPSPIKRKEYADFVYNNIEFMHGLMLSHDMDGQVIIAQDYES